MTLDELVELTEEIARTAYRRGWAEALESSAYETPRGRKPPVIPHKDALNEGSANCIGDLRPVLMRTLAPASRLLAMQEALEAFYGALKSLPEDALGFANDDHSQWPIRDELMSRIDAILSPNSGGGDE